MFAVAFEVLPSETGYQRYLDIAAALRPQLDEMDGFLSIERFRSTADPGWILSLSFWRDEEALVRWRMHGEHRAAQAEGRASVFRDYRLRVVRIITDSAAAQEDARDSVQEHQALAGFLEYADPSDTGQGRLFESLTNAGKHIALGEFTDRAAALAWHARHAELRPQARVRCGVVERDYGMFDRRQVPQIFPGVPYRPESP